MKTNGLLTGAAMGAVAVALAGAGGYWAHAEMQSGAAVNSPRAAVAAPSATPGSFADIIERVAPAVVSVDIERKADDSGVAFVPPGFNAPDDQGQGSPFGFDMRKLFPQQPDQQRAPPKVQATGSGFFISSDGYIATNNHVVESADKITVRTSDDRELTAHLVGRDPATDLAVIKVDGQGFPFVSFEDRAKPRVGDWVVAVGNPYNLGGTATAGIVSALGRSNVSGSSYVDFMQIDAPINRGNSGGPTFDVYGRVVGVNTAIFSPSGGSVGIGFDIPADVAASVTKQLIASGSVVRGYIGANIQTVTPEIADSLGIPKDKGALVAQLTPGGPAEKAGLKPGDLVQKVNGHDVTSAADLTRQVGLARPGETIHLVVRRDGSERDVDIRSGQRPPEDQLASNQAPSGPGAQDQDQGAPVLGMRLVGAPEGGVAVKGVAPDSDAAEKGLQAGDIIVRAGDANVATPSDVTAAAAAARKAGRKSVLLQVARNGHRIFVPIKLDEAAG
jgi:serine protease Do